MRSPKRGQKLSLKSPGWRGVCSRKAKHAQGWGRGITRVMVMVTRQKMEGRVAE
jgi:hypothetical protein